MSRYEYDYELITTLSSLYRDAVATALSGGPLNVKQVSVLFGVSYNTAGKWAYQPRFHAYKSKPDRGGSWCFPVDAVEEVLGFKLRRAT